MSNRRYEIQATGYLAGSEWCVPLGDENRYVSCGASIRRAEQQSRQFPQFRWRVFDCYGNCVLWESGK